MANDLGIRIGLEGVAAYNRGINDVETNTNRAMGGIGGVFDNAKKSFSSFASEVPILGNAFRLLSNPIGLVSAAVIGLGTTFATFTKTSAALEEQLSTVGALQGLERTDAAFESLTAKARELGRTTEFTAREAGEAMEFLSKAGFDASQVLASTEQTLSLATVGSLELGRAAEVAGDTLSQFALPVEQLGRVVDAIAKATVSANTNVEQFAEAMKFLGPSANAFGVSIEESAAAIGVLANSGLKGTAATTTLATAFNRLADPPRKAALAIKEYGIEAFNAQGEFIGIAPLIQELERGFEGLSDKQRAAAISSIFGQQATKQFQILLGAGSDELRRYTAEIEAASAQGGKFSANIRQIKLDNFNGALKLLNSAWEDFQIAITTNALPALKGFVDFLSTAIQGVTNFIESGKGLGDIFKQYAPQITLAVTALIAYNANTIAAIASSLTFSNIQKVLAVSLGKSSLATRALAIVQGLYSTASGLLAGKLTIAAVAQNALNIALKANPIGLVITAIGLLVAGVIQLYKRSETFRAIWAGVVNVVSDSVAKFKELFTTNRLFRTGLLSLFGPIGALAANFDKVKAFGQGLLNLWNEYGPSAEQLRFALYRIIDPLGLLGDSFTEAGQTILSVKDWFIETWEVIIDGFGKAREAVADFFGFDIISAVGDFLAPLQALNRAVFDIAKSIGASFSDGFNDQLRNEGIESAYQDELKRLEGLGSNVEINTEVKGLEGNKLEVDTDEASDKLSTYRDKVETLGEKLGKLGVSLPAINQLDNLGAKLDEVNAKINEDPGGASYEGVTAQINGVSSSIENVISQFDKIGVASESLTGLGGSISEISRLLNTGTDAELFTGISEKSELIKTQIAGAMSEISGIVKDTTLSLGEIQGIEGIENIPGLAEKAKLSLLELAGADLVRFPLIDNLNNELVSAQNSINQTNEVLSNLGSESGANPEAVENIQSNLGGLQRQIENINTDIAGIGSESGPVDITAIGLIENQLSGLAQSILDAGQSFQQIGTDLNPAGAEAIEVLKGSLLSLLEQSNTTREGLTAITASVDPAAVMAVTDLQNRLIGLKTELENVGNAEGDFQGLISQASGLKTEIDLATNRIVNFGDITKLSLSDLEQKLNDVQAATKLLDPNSTAISVLINQADTLSDRIDVVKAKFDLISEGINPNPVFIPIQIQAPEQAVDLGIVTEPAIVPVEIQTNVEEVNLAGLEALAARTGASFEVLKNTFFDVAAATEALEGPVGRMLSNFGKTDGQILETIGKFNELKKSVGDTVKKGLVDTFAAMGAAIGDALVKGQGFAGAMKAVFTGLLNTILVEVPKLIGVFLIQTGVGLGFPAGVPFIIGGIALTALSGVAGGLLSKLNSAKSGETQVAEVGNISLPSTIQDGGEITVVQQNNLTPAAAVIPAQTQDTGLNQFGTAAPTTTNVYVNIGGEDLTDVLNTYYQTETELTGK